MTPWPVRWTGDWRSRRGRLWRSGPVDNSWTLLTTLTVAVGLAILGVAVLAP